MKIIAFLNKSLPKGLCTVLGHPSGCKIAWEVVIFLAFVIIIGINIS